MGFLSVRTSVTANDLERFFALFYRFEWLLSEIKCTPEVLVFISV